MGAHHFTQLIAWQRADELRSKVLEFTARPPAVFDRKYCQDTQGAAESAPSNIAEGFGRFSSREFLQYLRYAEGSLNETQDHLLSALKRQYVSQGEFDEMWRLSVRAIRANRGLQSYHRRRLSQASGTRARS
jgi:four helix bundle protein